MRPIHSTTEPIPGTPDRALIRLSPLDCERLECAARGIRLRGNTVQILLKWKTARRLQRTRPRKAA